MKALVVAVAALSLWTLAACSFPAPESSPASSSSSALPESGGALPPPDDSEVPSESGEASGSGGSESAGVVIESIQPEPSAGGQPAAIAIPQGDGWTQAGVPLTKQQEDIETCFTFAAAQVEREAFIDDDRYAATSDLDALDLYGETTLTRRVDYYSQKRRRGALFDTCMESKGYVRD